MRSWPGSGKEAAYGGGDAARRAGIWAKLCRRAPGTDGTGELLTSYEVVELGES